MGAKSNSQSGQTSFFDRVVYSGQILGLHGLRMLNPPSFDDIADETTNYRQIYETFTSKRFDDARVLEIGFGQRPYRLVTLHTLGVNVAGVDLDQPLYRLTPSTVRKVLHRNGTVRTAKTLVRRMIFDGTEYRALARMLRRRFGRKMEFLKESQLVVGDIGDLATWTRLKGPFDFMYSEDVFEHVPAEAIPQALRMIHDALDDRGVVVIAPMIFTGISGGHDVGWYCGWVESSTVQRGPAWGHLTGENKPGDTFLNKLRRADYRRLFSEFFVIEREDVLMPDLGRQFLTDERRSSLAEYSEDELFSNKVRFVLRKKMLAN
jgi:Methyltransferase domain